WWVWAAISTCTRAEPVSGPSGRDKALARGISTVSALLLSECIGSSPCARDAGPGRSPARIRSDGQSVLCRLASPAAPVLHEPAGAAPWQHLATVEPAEGRDSRAQTSVRRCRTYRAAASRASILIVKIRQLRNGVF